jgi:peptidyl-prolyl cis-trans isomerase D
MLKILRGGQRWLTGLFVIAIGGVFVFFLGLGGPLSGRSQRTLIEVGPYRFGDGEFERVRSRVEAAIQQQMGEAYDARDLAETIDGLAARDLVNTALLALAAQDMGLTVSKSEIEQLVLADPSFRDAAGRFDRAEFENWVSWVYGSQSSFMQDRRMILLAHKMRGVLAGLPHVSAGEARQTAVAELEEVRLIFVVLDGADASGAEVELETELIMAAVAERGEELERLYDELRSRYDVPEQVRARHILIQVARDADEAEIEARRAAAQDALDQLAAGADFAELARDLSDDAGTQESGGDLGFFGRGQMVPAFEEAAFALQPGQTSELVRTDFGFHVIRLEERREGQHRTFEEVREELAEELLQREAREIRARTEAEQLAEAIRSGASLEEAAREREIDLKRSGGLSRRADGFVPGLGAAPDLLASAFDLAPGESSPRIFEVNGKLALLQVAEHRMPAEVEVTARMDEVRERLQETKAELRADDWVNARRTALIEADQLYVDLEPLRRR